LLTKGDVVKARGRLKTVVDFLATADKETIRILASFFEGDAKGPADAKRLTKPVLINKFYDSGAVVEVQLSKNYVWDEKLEYWEKVEEEPTGVSVLAGGSIPPDKAAHMVLEDDE
jgi:hypothetical protein